MLYLRNAIVLLFLTATLVCSAYAEPTVSSNKDNNVYYKKFQEVFEKISKEYVNEPDKQKMLDAALSGMLSSLDPHSMYFTAEELEDFLNYTKGEFGGIGVEIVFESGAIKVISPIDDLPADKAGIKAGDYVIAINGEAVNQLGYSKAVKQMRGDPGTKVKLTVIREGEHQTKEYELTREIVKMNPVKYHLDGNIAYIRLVTFSEHTISELKKAMKNIMIEAKKPIKGIILDVRNNPGGLLEQAVDVSEYFVDSGVIVTTQGRTGSSNASFSASKFAAKAPNVPIVILINGGSASASEIVAGALQDYKRAIILGTRSFGKGSVQTLMHVGNHTAMKLTTAKYYTPHGRSIQAEGITPDIFVEQAKIEYAKHNADEKGIAESILKNHLKNDKDLSDNKKQPSTNTARGTTTPSSMAKDAIDGLKEVNGITQGARDPSEMYKKDYQYARAYDLLLGLSLTHSAKK